ncbi:hypothetical protein [Streptomyces sp. NPDC053720]|uniref:hypothetical protein n=1 Tax=Streptomyces sp. NPDC053720 TaxID=3154855 RepID=UPI003446BBAC
MDAQRENLDDQRSKPEWTRARGDPKTGVWGFIMVVVMTPAVGLLDMIALDPSRVTDYAWDTRTAAVLMCIWIGLPLFTRWIEPRDLPLDRLAGRTARATITRMVANTAGICYVSVLIYAQVFTSRPSLLVPVAVTLGGILIVSGHKTWTRLRTCARRHPIASQSDWMRPSPTSCASRLSKNSVRQPPPRSATPVAHPSPTSAFR